MTIVLSVDRYSFSIPFASAELFPFPSAGPFAGPFPGHQAGCRCDLLEVDGLKQVDRLNPPLHQIPIATVSESTIRGIEVVYIDIR